MRVFSKLCFTVAAVALTVVSARPADAAIILVSGNVGSITDENVNLANGQVGISVFGAITGFDVRFTGAETSETQASGSKIEAVDGAFTYMMVNLVAPPPGASFTSLVLNIDLTDGWRPRYGGLQSSGHERYHHTFNDQSVNDNGQNSSPFTQPAPSDSRSWILRPMFL